MAKKSVIYTSLVGNYDTLLQPSFVSDDFDYICFSNDIPEKKIGVWKIEKIPFSHPNNTRLSRYAKLLPHRVLPEYEYSVWIDTNIRIVSPGFYERIEEFIVANEIVAQVQHPTQNCLYDEVLSCIRCSKDKVKSLKRQYEFLRINQYPAKNGLYENNLIFRKHHDARVMEVSEQWWQLYMRFSQRDQLSLCYIYWKLGLSPALFLEEGHCTRNHPFFVYEPHLPPPILKRLWVKCIKTRNKFYLRVCPLDKK